MITKIFFAIIASLIICGNAFADMERKSCLQLRHIIVKDIFQSYNVDNAYELTALTQRAATMQDLYFKLNCDTDVLANEILDKLFVK